MKKLLASAIVLATTLAYAQPPQAVMDNGPLHAVVYLPDAQNGFYRGSRFDWAGIIGDLRFAGHRFYGPWFDRSDPTVRDFIYDGDQIVVGPASGATGPAEEFRSLDDAAFGYSDAAVGDTFVKIGVGVLRKTATDKYSMFGQYPIVDGGKWTLHAGKQKIEFTQQVNDPGSGYGYIYTKTLRMLPGKPVLMIEHSLKNIGKRPIATKLYDHNFLTLDRATTGTDFSITVPFQIKPERPYKTELGSVDGNRITYRKTLQNKESFGVYLGGYGDTAKDYDIRVENAAKDVGVHITGDRPLAEEELWSIRSTLAMEPFIRIDAVVGETARWTYTYEYYTLKK